jgi:8-oxo-dGTP diphosphatase
MNDEFILFLSMNTLNLHFEDDSWKRDFPESEYHDREISRAIVLDGNKLLFAHIIRNDMFANLGYLETSGGGLEPEEDEVEGLRRELREELGIEVEIITKLGDVIDYYNLIKRRNINHYYLVKKVKDVENHLMPDEERFQLTKVKVTFEEAFASYEKIKDDKLGHLVYQREMPMIQLAKDYLEEHHHG